ncbi:MerR family transcriptional regulator [Acidovorax sp. Root275]|uniref:MerR family transcriptional regulator n=1 Tax=Acidovorax sp. Root275 TaxID=1736508 RepID=UPI00070BA1E7|nr:MerR family transcriptional regulator [Acidovorax sp. Root275]KRD46324.1 MerR family transcriptional regulator [Acidovorax sp. Root275]
MRIGELAHRTGTTPKAIRLYESRGLLGSVARAGSYRHYGEADVARVLLIRQAQALGFRLSELDGLPHIDTAAGWERMAQLVAGRRAAVAQELARLAALDTQLAVLEAELHTCDTLAVPVTPQACAAPPALPVMPPEHKSAPFSAATTAGAARFASP